MKKKVVAVLLTLGMVSSLLAGCGSKETTDTGVETKTEEKAEKPAEKPAEEKAEEPAEESAETEWPEYLNMDGGRRIVKEGYDVTLDIMVCRELNATGDINDQWFVQFVEKELGINLNVEEVTYEVGAQKKQLQLSSGELPDINFYLGLNNNAQVQYGMEEELLLPISDYFSEELTPNLLGLMETHPLIEEVYTLPNGKMYTYPAISNGLPGAGDSFIFINQDYLDAIGMAREDVPTTLDGFLDMLREFKKLDPADMGVDEIIPFAGCDTVEEIPINHAMGWACGYNQFLNPVWDVQAHDVVIPALTEKYYNWVEVFRTMYSEGLMDKDYYTVEDDATRAMIAEGKVACYSDYGTTISEKGWENWFCPELASEFNGNKGVLPTGTGLNYTHVFASAETEYPEVIVRLIDYMMSPEGSVYCQYGPPAGSDDCMGIVEGYTIDEETGLIVFPEGESAYAYSLNNIKMAQCQPRNEEYLLTYAYELLGAKAPIDPVYGQMTEGMPNLNYERYKASLEGDFFVGALPGCFMDMDTANRAADLKTLLDDHRASETAKFVTGVRPMEEWDDFVQELKDLGSEEYQKIYDDAYANYTREGR